MLTGIHVIVALLSLGAATANQFRPAKSLLRISYGLAVGTLASGALLILLSHASVIRTCVTGVVFLGVVSLLNESARLKLSTHQTTTDKA